MGRRRKKRYKPASGPGGTFGININSMTDMFVLLLVFLLQFQNSSDVQINPDKDVLLPLSSSEANPVPGVQVQLSQSVLKVEEKSVAGISNLDFQKTDIDANDSNFITPLFSELSRLIENEKKKDVLAKAGDTTVKANVAILEGRMILIADSSYSYQTLRKVMYTASMAGFPKLKLATIASGK